MNFNELFKFFIIFNNNIFYLKYKRKNFNNLFLF